MPPSLIQSGLVQSGLAPSTEPHPAGHSLPRDFGQRRRSQDRWPMPLAAAAILGMSVTLWFALIQAGRMAAAMAGY